MSHYDVCRLWFLSPYDVCCIMIFVTIWRTVCRLWRLLPYCVCRLWCLSHFDVCRLRGLMAWCLWRLSQCLLFMWRHTLRIYVQCSNNLSVFSVHHTTVLFFCFIPFIFTVIYRSRLLHSEHQEFFYLVCFTLIRALLLLYSVQCTIVTYLACFLCYNM